MLNITRWCQNLSGILQRHGDVEAALPYARTGLYAAATLADPQQVELASAAIVALLAPQESRGAAADVLRAAESILASVPPSANREASLVVIRDFLSVLATEALYEHKKSNPPKSKRAKRSSTSP